VATYLESISNPVKHAERESVDSFGGSYKLYSLYQIKIFIKGENLT
jgi:hypothetical protein